MAQGACQQECDRAGRRRQHHVLYEYLDEPVGPEEPPAPPVPPFRGVAGTRPIAGGWRHWRTPRAANHRPRRSSPALWTTPRDAFAGRSRWLRQAVAFEHDPADRCRPARPRPRPTPPRRGRRWCLPPSVHRPAPAGYRDSRLAATSACSGHGMVRTGSRRRGGRSTSRPDSRASRRRLRYTGDS